MSETPKNTRYGDKDFTEASLIRVTYSTHLYLLCKGVEVKNSVLFLDDLYEIKTKLSDSVLEEMLSYENFVTREIPNSYLQKAIKNIGRPFDIPDLTLESLMGEEDALLGRAFLAFYLDSIYIQLATVQNYTIEQIRQKVLSIFIHILTDAFGNNILDDSGVTQLHKGFLETFYNRKELEVLLWQCNHRLQTLYGRLSLEV